MCSHPSLSVTQHQVIGGERYFDWWGLGLIWLDMMLIVHDPARFWYLENFFVLTCNRASNGRA